MRGHLIIAMMFVAASGAQAADMPDFPPLRGSQGLTTTAVNWQGWYIGGQGGYGSSDANLSGSKMFSDPLFRAMYAPNSSLLVADPVIGGLFPQGPLFSTKPPGARLVSEPSAGITRSGMTLSSALKQATCMAGLEARLR